MVCSSPLQFLPGFSNREGLGEGGGAVMEIDFVAALADQLSVSGDNSTNAVCAGFGVTLAGQRHRTRHPDSLFIASGHAGSF